MDTGSLPSTIATAAAQWIFFHRLGSCYLINCLVPEASLCGHSPYTALRLTLFTVLNQMAGALTLFAPDCSSWGLPCRGTSMRSFINPEGFESYQFVANANCMVSRNLVRMSL